MKFLHFAAPPPPLPASRVAHGLSGWGVMHAHRHRLSLCVLLSFVARPFASVGVMGCCPLAGPCNFVGGVHAHLVELTCRAHVLLGDKRQVWSFVKAQDVQSMHNT